MFIIIVLIVSISRSWHQPRHNPKIPSNERYVWNTDYEVFERPWVRPSVHPIHWEFLRTFPQLLEWIWKPRRLIHVLSAKYPFHAEIVPSPLHFQDTDEARTFRLVLRAVVPRWKKKKKEETKHTGWDKIPMSRIHIANIMFFSRHHKLTKTIDFPREDYCRHQPSLHRLFHLVPAKILLWQEHQ